MRSHAAASLAVRLGYKNVYRFAEGLPKLKEAGLLIAQGDHSSDTAQKQKGASPAGLDTGVLMTLLGVFFGGIALNLTPCVYPLIPITASYFGGRSEVGARQGNLVLHGSLYILGLAAMNTALGVSAAFTGKLMGSILQHPAALIFVSTVMFVMALNFFGLWELRLPSSMNSVVSKSQTGYVQSLFMGLTLGIIAAPCIGPFIIGLLTMVAQKGDPLVAFLIFFTLSIGLGLPLFVLSVFAGNLSKVPRAGEWMLWIRSLFGWIMIAMAVYFVKPLFPRHEIGTFMLALIALVSAVHLGFLSKAGNNLRVFKAIKRGVGVLVTAFSLFLASSVFLQGPAVAWQAYSRETFSQALASGKPVILDFYADWCTPCRLLDRQTFHDPDVVKESAKFSMVKVDLTNGADPDVAQLLKKYDVKGVPTVIFLDPQAIELSALQTIDFVPGKEFHSKMKNVLEK